MSGKVETQENDRRKNETKKCAQDTRQQQKIDASLCTETENESVKRSVRRLFK